MSLDSALRLMAGCVVLISLALAHFLNPNWLYLTGFVGLNLLQSAFTKWCPAVTIFKVLGLEAEACAAQGMSVQQGVHIIAGSMILLTTAAVLFFSAPSWVLVITAVLGLSLLQSAFSGWCPAFTIARLVGFGKA